LSYAHHEKGNKIFASIGVLVNYKIMGMFPMVPSLSSMVLAIYIKGGDCPLENFLKKAIMKWKQCSFFMRLFKRC